MAMMKGGIVHRADATASFRSLSSPTRRSGSMSNPAHRAPGKGKMADPVKAAGKMLKRGGK